MTLWKVGFWLNGLASLNKEIELNYSCIKLSTAIHIEHFYLSELTLVRPCHTQTLHCVREEYFFIIFHFLASCICLQNILLHINMLYIYDQIMKVTVEKDFKKDVLAASENKLTLN